MESARVLIVEDEEDVRELMVVLLSARGCVVESAVNAAQALPLLRTRDYDVVLCDIRLPGVDGRTLYQQVQAERPEMARRFLICTGDSVSPETEQFLRSSRLPVLLKPFRSEDLLDALLPFLRHLSRGRG